MAAENCECCLLLDGGMQSEGSAKAVACHWHAHLALACFNGSVRPSDCWRSLFWGLAELHQDLLQIAE